ncbi:MAG: glycosyltransferase, partial [Gimesia chilikensis]
TYPKLELVLVDALSTGLDSFLEHSGEVPVNVVNQGKRLLRSAAANAGLEQARGEYILFLDDDDWIAPDHISQLVTYLESEDGCDAVYSSTRRVNNAGEELDYLFDDDFDQFLLMRDNFIPIHAMLFARSLVDKGCRFDESLDLYEDWDFWLQLNQHTVFSHLDTVTAFYRESGASGIDEGKMIERLDPSGPLGQARARVFDKWLKRWNGADFNRLVGEIDNTNLIAQLNAELKAENAAKAEKE